MKAPDKIYVAESLIKTLYGNEWSPTPYMSRENTEYIRKDVVDETIKTAEDHAYFAGQEKLREKLMEWAKELKFLVKDEPGASFKGTEVVINEVIKKIQSL